MAKSERQVETVTAEEGEKPAFDVTKYLGRSDFTRPPLAEGIWKLQLSDVSVVEGKGTKGPYTKILLGVLPVEPVNVGDNPVHPAFMDHRQVHAVWVSEERDVVKAQRLATSVFGASKDNVPLDMGPNSKLISPGFESARGAMFTARAYTDYGFKPQGETKFDPKSLQAVVG